MLERYLAAVEYAGPALTWNDESIVIHSVETLNPSLLDPWLRHWAGDARPLDLRCSRACRRPPWPSPPAMSTASACFDALSQIVPDKTSPG